MRYFGYPKETQGTVPWKDKPMRIIDGKTWWFEDCGIWWCEETAEEFTDEEYVGRMKRLSKILNEPRIGFVKEHGSKRRPPPHTKKGRTPVKERGQSQGGNKARAWT